MFSKSGELQRNYYSEMSEREKGLFIPNFITDKKEIIDFAFRQYAIKSFADLGGCWGVDGAYSYYALDQFDVDAGVLIDTNITAVAHERSHSYPNLKLIQGNFGDTSIFDCVGFTDAIFMFDILLHQVMPNWDQILDMYAELTNCFIIYNQQYTASSQSVRLLDLGRSDYFENVPHDPEHQTYSSLFDKMYEINPKHGRIWRDIHNVWQWGITDKNLIDKMASLGFSMEFYKNCGMFGNLKNFENHAFVFRKKKAEFKS